MLAPNKMKFRKQQRGKNRGAASRNNKLAFGDYGLIVTKNTYITPNQIEAGRISIMRRIRGTGKIWIKIFPDIPYTKKPLEVRQGKGKGALDHYVARVKRGALIFEIGGNITEEAAMEALRQASHKFPVKCKIIKRDSFTGV